jgi:hypothetical protein
VIKDDAGEHTMRKVGVVFQDHKDSFSDKCSMTR